MPKPLVDLLWRTHPDAPGGGTRGPRARNSISEVIERSVALADRSGLGSVTIRALAESLSISTMSVYTHINSRDDLLVLMVDSIHITMARPAFGRADWRTDCVAQQKRTWICSPLIPGLSMSEILALRWGPGRSPSTTTSCTSSTARASKTCIAMPP